MKISIVVSVLFLTWTVQSARILGVFPVPGKSHYFLGSSLMRALAEKGHDVTIISPFSENNLPKGGSYREILLPEMLAQLETRRNEINMYELGEVSPFINIPFLAYLMSEIGEIIFKETNVQKLINSGEKFDAVIVEQFFSDAHKVLAYHFDAVQIVFSSVGANIWINSLVGNPSPPSYIPDSMLSYSAHMTFLERLKNTLISLLNTCVHHLYLYPKHNGIIQKYFPNGPDVHDVLYNASLVLLNSHPSLNQPVPHVPNMIEIGGFHIKPPKQLPQDLQEFLDNAKDGVIYFSMGSNLRSADLPSEKRDAILKAFSKFKQRILWKWEDDVLPGQPENVKLGKWFPQQEILAHPNVRLFITHGGLLSSIETVYFGVPILVIPIYGDQKLNAQLAIDGAKILGVFPVPGRSHYLLGSTLLKALAEKGHDVTMISCFGEKDPPKNGTYRDVVVSGLLEAMQDGQKDQKMNLFNREDSNPFTTAVFFGFMMPQFMEVILKDESVQKLINSDEKFDVVIVEQFLNDAQKALSTHFGAPLITFNTVGPNFWINPLVGNPSPLSYVPDMMLDYTAPMTFFQRLLNTLLYVFNEIFYNLYMFPEQNKVLKNYIVNGPDLCDILYNTSIVLLNSHSSINQAVPHVPNMIEIGGFHVKPPRKLPNDLQEFLDNSKNGVIYFSMGSNLKSVDLPIEKRNAILNTFSKLKENVLWKWEDDSLPGQPPNVKLSKWLPQQDVLAHPNVKLFITHGGYLSTTETIYHGVPILAIPIYGDQKLNALTAVNNGYGVVVPYSQLSEEKLTNTIHEILNNNKYRENAKLRSRIFHDRLVSPMDTAIYWVEYVIRHKGAPHLRVAGLDLPWYQYHLLDVIAFTALIGSCSLLIFYHLTHIICKMLFFKDTKKLKKQ